MSGLILFIIDRFASFVLCFYWLYRPFSVISRLPLLHVSFLFPLSPLPPTILILGMNGQQLEYYPLCLYIILEA